MLYITYENEIGKLHFGGGTSYSPWRIIEIEGLGLTGKDFNSTSYPGEIGQHTLSETLQARTITIQCDVHSTYNNRIEISKALRILNLPGIITIQDEYKKRKISARCVNSALGERYGGFRIFALQFICDYPYFEDNKDTIIPIFKIENLIGSDVRWYKNDNGELMKELIATNNFKLPCLLTRRISESNVLNLGDVDSEPIIKIIIQGDNYTGENSGTLFIKNSSTNQQIELNCNAVEGDIITIDIPNRKIYNQHKDNLISYLSPTSFLSDFWLQKGENLISVKNNITGSCVVECEFTNKYVEAVI